MTTVDFARRSSATELMDSPSIGFDEFHQCLRQLTIVNGCVLAYRPTLRWLKAMLRDAPADKRSRSSTSVPAAATCCAKSSS